MAPTIRKLFPTFQPALFAMFQTRVVCRPFAIVDAVPEPVTPGSVWNGSPAAIPAMSFFHRIVT
jgi:hypothetical protein